MIGSGMGSMIDNAARLAPPTTTRRGGILLLIDALFCFPPAAALPLRVSAAQFVIELEVCRCRLQV